MLHHVAHAFPPDFLFRDWTEARALWDRLVALGPLRAAVLMPDHVHVIARSVDREAWLHALRAYARWRNHRRAEPGRSVWLPSPPPDVLADAKHFRRTWRYVVLNPCREELVADPLAWPFDTHRDAVGLAIPEVVDPARDPADHHAYMSADPSVRVEGTALPAGLHGSRAPTLHQVRAAVSALTRRPLTELAHRGPARTLLVQAAVAFCNLRQREVARALGLSHTAVGAAGPLPGGHRRRLERVLGDPRFPALDEGDLTLRREWRWYREQRIRRGAYDKLLREAGPALRRQGRAGERA